MDTKNIKKAWESYEQYLIETRYAVRDPETGEPREHSYDDVVSRIVQELRENRKREVEKNSIEERDLEYLIAALRGRYVIPASPCLMSFGNPYTRRKGYFSCFPLGTVGDSMDEIRKMCEKMEAIYIRGGGCGIDISKLRPKGSLVDNGQGVASGPVGFLAKFDAVTGTTNQGGRRRGALLVQMDWNHPDIKAFIKAKASAGKIASYIQTLPPEERPEQNPVLSNMNISVNVFGDFWKQEELVNLIAEQMWKTGDPGLLFTDNMQKWAPFQPEDNPRFSNPCLAGNTLVVDIEPEGPAIWRIEVAARSGDSPTPQGMTAWRTGKREVLRLAFDNGAVIETTFDHMFSTPLGWKPACELKPGSYVYASTVDRTLVYWLAEVLPRRNFPSVQTSLTKLRNMANIEYLSPDQVKEMALHFANLFRSMKRVPRESLPQDLMFVLSSLTGIHVQLDGDHYTLAVGALPAFYSLFEGNPVPATHAWTVQVVSVEPAGKKDVYDFTMFDGKPYSIANGVIVHNCGEYLAPANTACNLITVNVAKIAYECWNPEDGSFDFPKFFTQLAYYADLACFLGNILIDCDDGYPLDEIRKETQRIRPVGVGMTGFHTALILAFNGEFTYGSRRSRVFAENVQTVLTIGSLVRSARLTEKHGKVYKWNPDYLRLHLEELESRVQTLDANFPGSTLSGLLAEVVRCGTTFGGFYNACTTSQPPTGSVSAFARVGGDTGIEPMFAIELTRRVRDFESGWVTVNVVTEALVLALAKRPELRERIEAQLAHKISPEAQLEMLGAFQKFVHTGVSKTVNVPEETSVEDIKRLILRAKDLRLKGFTVFRSGSRDDSVYVT